jgi:2-phosphosulfolactate phosphatase
VIDVAFTGARSQPCDLAVVIDVLRATSTVTQALAAGYRRVLCVDTLDRARSVRAPGRVLAGERGCLTPAGFDQGNSPVDAARLRGEELVLTSTNGTPAIIAAAARAPEVLLGCLLNLEAVTAAVLDRANPEIARIQLICSGTESSPALEDVYLAGLLSLALQGQRSDSALIAESVARQYATAAAALGASAHAQTLSSRDLFQDVEFCAQTSVLGCVPAVVTRQPGIAILADRATTNAGAEVTPDRAAPVSDALR